MKGEKRKVFVKDVIKHEVHSEGNLGRVGRQLVMLETILHTAFSPEGNIYCRYFLILYRK